MYNLKQPVQSEPRASERMASKRSKHSVGSGKQQAKRALGQIDTDLIPGMKQPEVSGGEAVGSYRTAMNEYRATMSDAVSKSKKPADDYSDLEDNYGEDAVASRPPEYTPRPRLPGDSGKISYDDSAKKLQRESGDEDFIGSVERLADKYNITTREVYEIIDGESNWTPDSVNSLGYKTLFQFGKDAITDINEFTDANVDYKTIEKLSPSEQVELYDKHLERWGYDGSVPLAVMQAAPAKAKSLKGKPDSTVVYSKNSKEWKANPGWRSKNDGPVTLGSLKGYYG